MSGVFRRWHEPTGNEFWDNAIELEISLTRFLMNEKFLPKKYRYIYAKPILDTVRRMWVHIVAATSIYPKTPELLKEKRDELKKAIFANETVIQEIQRMVLVLPIDVNKTDEIGDKLVRESALLRSARKNSRLQSDCKSEKQ